MLANVNWLHALVAFALGWLLGQRFSHMHPVPMARSDASA